MGNNWEKGRFVTALFVLFNLNTFLDSPNSFWLALERELNSLWLWAMHLTGGWEDYDLQRDERILRDTLDLENLSIQSQRKLQQLLLILKL